MYVVYVIWVSKVLLGPLRKKWQGVLFVVHGWIEPLRHRHGLRASRRQKYTIFRPSRPRIISLFYLSAHQGSDSAVLGIVFSGMR